MHKACYDDNFQSFIGDRYNNAFRNFLINCPDYIDRVVAKARVRVFKPRLNIIASLHPVQFFEFLRLDLDNYEHSLYKMLISCPRPEYSHLTYPSTNENTSYIPLEKVLMFIYHLNKMPRMYNYSEAAEKFFEFKFDYFRDVARTLADNTDFYFRFDIFIYIT